MHMWPTMRPKHAAEGRCDWPLALGARAHHGHAQARTCMRMCMRVRTRAGAWAHHGRGSSGGSFALLISSARSSSRRQPMPPTTRKGKPRTMSAYLRPRAHVARPVGIGPIRCTQAGP